ncbi:MAG TPA: hypothetical protein PKM44_14710 [Turneriella sp.]|nr:hypothetical protein [Turneriella sp.]HNE18551.1 hypothetical protein [Turneriella sp.]HNJ65124.1 hypothetical protein [Turneriella sp.]HNL11764.1 hypothetical protein [Turneriella sp.]HNL52916.1 hypothetical protein [Turneriella sp.]
MSELKNEPVIAVKGRFRAPNQRYYGQFFYLINNKGGYIDVASVVITVGSDVYNALNPTDSWKKYESLINKLKYENKFSQAITNEFQAKLKQLALDKQYFADLMKAVVGNKAETLNFVLANFYRRVIKDDEFYLEGHAEKASLDGNDETPASQEADIGGADGVYLPVKLDLDPISGKDVKEVRPGDKILVRVLPETERANAFIDGAGLRTDSGFVRSAPFTVTSVIYPGVGVELVGKLKEGIYGKIVEEQNVLVRTAEAVKSAASPKAQAPLAASIPDEKKQLMLIGIGVIGTALLGIVLYWVISSL